MVYISSLIVVACVSLVTATYAYAESRPSSGAQGMPGAKGTFEFIPNDHIADKTTWWSDTDGVDPGVAGCHIGTNEKGIPNGSSFGEACLSETLLVESNPGQNELHSHSQDIGHPDTFDCNARCVGGGKRNGRCEAMPSPPCEQSAACLCE